VQKKFDEDEPPRTRWKLYGVARRPRPSWNDAMLQPKNLRNVSLQSGGKHYIGQFDMIGKINGAFNFMRHCFSEWERETEKQYRFKTNL